MSRRWKLGLAAVASVAGLGMAVYTLSLERRGVGFVRHRIVVEADRPVWQVMYGDANLSPEERNRVEQGHGAGCRDWCDETAKPIADDQFSASIMFTDRESAFGGQVIHRAHLVVLVEFEDGTVAGRVFDLPPGAAPATFVVRVP